MPTKVVIQYLAAALGRLFDHQDSATALLGEQERNPVALNPYVNAKP